MGAIQWWPRADGSGSDILFRDAFGGKIAFDPECCCVQTPPGTGCCPLDRIPSFINLTFNNCLALSNPYCEQVPAFDICEFANSTQFLLDYSCRLSWECSLGSECIFISPPYFDPNIKCSSIGGALQPVYIWGTAFMELDTSVVPAVHGIGAGLMISIDPDPCSALQNLNFTYQPPAGTPDLTKCYGEVLQLEPTFPWSQPGDMCCLNAGDIGCATEPNPNTASCQLILSLGWDNPTVPVPPGGCP